MSTAGDTETAEAGVVLDVGIVKFCVDLAHEEQQVQDMGITASEATSTPVKSIAGVKGNNSHHSAFFSADKNVLKAHIP
jgi:hypothetical protein